MENGKGRTCLIPECDKPSKTRGLCGNHYEYCIKNIIQPGLKTWEQLEQEGKVLPTHTRSRYVKDYFGV